MGVFNTFQKKRPLEETEDLEKDLASIMEFLQNINRDVKDIHDLAVKVKKARAKERTEVDDKRQKKLLVQEINVWDTFLEKFVMFDRDVDITGERVKKISNLLKEEAKSLELPHIVQKKVTTKDEWVFNW